MITPVVTQVEAWSSVSAQLILPQRQIDREHAARVLSQAACTLAVGYTLEWGAL